MPLVLHLHAGAFIGGSLDTGRVVPTLLAEAGATVVSVDYPHAPKRRPQALLLPRASLIASREAPQASDVLPLTIRISGRLEDPGNGADQRIVREGAPPLVTDQPVADVGMPVAPGASLEDRVVRVDEAQPRTSARSRSSRESACTPLAVSRCTPAANRCAVSRQSRDGRHRRQRTAPPPRSERRPRRRSCPP